MAQPESALQSRLFTELNDYDDPRIKWIFAVPNGRFRNARTAMALKREGVKQGVLDVCAPIKGQKGESGAYVEMKHGYNKCTPEQEEFISFIHEQGYVTAVCYEWETALHFLLNYLGVKPKWKHKWDTLVRVNPALLKSRNSINQSGQQSCGTDQSSKESPTKRRGTKSSRSKTSQQ